MRSAPRADSHPPPAQIWLQAASVASGCTSSVSLALHWHNFMWGAGHRRHVASKWDVFFNRRKPPPKWVTISCITFIVCGITFVVCGCSSLSFQHPITPCPPTGIQVEPHCACELLVNHGDTQYGCLSHICNMHPLQDVAKTNRIISQLNWEETNTTGSVSRCPLPQSKPIFQKKDVVGVMEGDDRHDPQKFFLGERRSLIAS